MYEKYAVLEQNPNLYHVLYRTPFAINFDDLVRKVQNYQWYSDSKLQAFKTFVCESDKYFGIKQSPECLLVHGKKFVYEIEKVVYSFEKEWDDEDDESYKDRRKAWKKRR